MSFQTVLHGNNTSYILDISSDLSTPIKFDSKISFKFFEAEFHESELPGSIFISESPSGFYTKGNALTTFKEYVSDAPTGYLSVETRNEDKSLFQIVNLDQDYSKLAFSLYQQSSIRKILPDGTYTYNYIYTEISPDLISNQSDSFFLNSKLDEDGTITLSLLQNPALNIDQILKYIPFENDTVYKLKIDLSKLFENENETEHEINYITEQKIETVTTQYNNYANNVIYTTNKIDCIKDIDTVLSCSDNLNYKFTPTIKNVDKLDVKFTDENIQEQKIYIDIQDKLETLYIKQYLSEYEEYFNSIRLLRTQNQITNLISEQQLKNIKQIFLKNSNLVNSTFKGNTIGMTTAFNIFCLMTGYHLLTLEESPLLHNFVYRITSSLPKEHWTGIIKDIIHPVSWADEYIYVDVIDPNYNLYYEYTKRYIILKRETPVSYLDISNKERYHLYPDIFDLSIFDDYHQNFKFNFNANEYTADVTGYTNSELISILQQPENLQINVDVKSNGIEVNVDYLFTGVALEYEYTISLYGTVYQKVILYTSSFNIMLPYSAEQFSIGVSLINRDFYAENVVSYTETSLNLIDKEENFEISVPYITFKYHEFKTYIWTILFNTEVIINISTTSNVLDVSNYIGIGYTLKLSVVYSDGYTRELNTIINL